MPVVERCQYLDKEGVEPLSFSQSLWSSLMSIDHIHLEEHRVNICCKFTQLCSRAIDWYVEQWKCV